MKKWKTLVAAGLVGSMLASGSVQAAEQDIQVFVEGKPVSFQKAPFLSEGTTLVPFRALFESLGLTIEWKEETRTVVGSGDGIAIELQLDNNTAAVNGEKLTLSVAPRSVDGFTFVPLRFVGEATGRQVEWEGATLAISIGKASFDYRSFYQSIVASTNAEDVEAIVAAFHPDAKSGIESELEQGLRIYTRHSTSSRR